MTLTYFEIKHWKFFFKLIINIENLPWSWSRPWMFWFNFYYVITPAWASIDPGITMSLCSFHNGCTNWSGCGCWHKRHRITAIIVIRQMFRCWFSVVRWLKIIIFIWIFRTRIVTYFYSKKMLYSTISWKIKNKPLPLIWLMKTMARLLRSTCNCFSLECSFSLAKSASLSLTFSSASKFEKNHYQAIQKIGT